MPELFEKESIFSQEGFEHLQEKLRTFLGKPELQLGLAALQGEQDLQGVHGLKALRVAVDTQASLMEENVSPELIKEAVRAMPQVAA